MYRERLLEEQETREALELLKRVRPLDIREYQRMAEQNHQMLGEYLKKVSPELVIHKLSESEQLQLKLEENIKIIKRDFKMGPDHINFYKYIFKAVKFKPISNVFTLEQYAEKTDLNLDFIKSMAEYMRSKEYIDFCYFTDNRIYWHIRNIDKLLPKKDINANEAWQEYKRRIQTKAYRENSVVYN